MAPAICAMFKEVGFHIKRYNRGVVPSSGEGLRFRHCQFPLVYLGQRV